MRRQRLSCTTPDGRRWVEATGREIHDLADDGLVYWGKGVPEPKSKYAGMYLPGDYPYLEGVCGLIPLYILQEEEKPPPPPEPRQWVVVVDYEPGKGWSAHMEDDDRRTGWSTRAGGAAGVLAAVAADLQAEADG